MSGVRPPALPGEPSGPLFSVILATVNERSALPELVARLVHQNLPPFEVVVVDDGSTDGTREYLIELASTDRRFRPIFHDGRQTTLRAQCQGIAVASGELLVVMDADLQHPPEAVAALVQVLVAGASLVVASRYALHGSPGPRTFARAVISRVAETAARLLLPEARRVSDPVSGFFGFRREIFRPLDPEYRGYKLLLFLLVMNDRAPVGEVGYSFGPRAGGESKLTQGTGFIRIFLRELVLARRFRRHLARLGAPPPDPSRTPP